jgi:D-alanyl-D-alanine carboxypeptidase/D-alanyl-D-alanine-endopeptidase (penicillin-binding protein 4)
VVEGPRLRYDHRGDVPLVPASTIKLLTATAALLAFGPDARLRTAVQAAAPPAGGVVAGDLTVVGGGDPLLATADYMSRFQRQPQVFTDVDALVTAIVDAGVRRIDGSVVGDETRYDTQRYVPTWPARYIDQGSTGPLSALAVNDGFARYPTKDDREVALEAAADPAANAAAVLTRRLEARGVSVVGAPRSGRAPAGGVEVAAVASPPLLDVVGQLLRESDNDTGEMLLKELGRVAGQATTSGGARRLAGLLDDGTVDLTGLQVVDGSGLAVDNRVTCDLLVDVLGRAGTGELLTDLLPVAGESGTLERRFADTPLAGVLRAKTGSLRAVSALAGFVTDDDPALTFAVVANVPDGTTLPTAVDGVEARVAEVLASWPRTPDVSVLGPQDVGG